MRTNHLLTVILVTFVLLACFSSRVQAEEAKLAVRLLPERQEWISGETICIAVIIENISTHGVLIPTAWSLGDKLLVKIEGYEHLSSPFALPDRLAYWTVSMLEPGERFHKTFGWCNVNFVREPGKYRIRAIFQSDGKYLSREGTFKECWKGRVESEWVEFEVVEPKTGADKAAYKLLTDNGKKDIWKSLGAYGYKYAPKESLQKVMEEYPTSTYARIACESLAARFVDYPPHLEKVINLREFAQKHWPEDLLVHVIDTRIVECLVALRRKEEALALIEKIKERTDNPRVHERLGHAIASIRYHLDGEGPEPEHPLHEDHVSEEPESPTPPKVPTPSRQPEPARGPALPWYVIVLICLTIVGVAVGLYLALVHRKR